MSSKGRVLVTGAAGFLGGHVVEEALAAGHDVRATDLPGTELSRWRKQGIEVVTGDLLHPAEAAALVRGVDHIIMVAAIFDLSRDREVLVSSNVASRRLLCEAALEVSPRTVVEISSCDAYGLQTAQPVDEEATFAPQNDYAVSKALAEQEALRFHRERGLPVTVLRPTAIYGPRGIYTAGLLVGLPCLIREAGVRRLWAGHGGLVNSFVHVRDVARAAVFLLDRPDAVGRAFNIADRSPLPMGALLRLLLTSVGIEVSDVPVAIPRRAVAAAAALGMRQPRSAFRWLNQWLSRRWTTLVARHHLIPALMPRLDPPFLSYATGDHTYRVSRLHRLGFEWAYPEMPLGWPETVDWYVQNRWIPDISSWQR